MGAEAKVARDRSKEGRSKIAENDSCLTSLAEELDEVACAVESAGQLTAVLDNHLFYTDEGAEMSTIRGAVLVLRGHLEKTARRCFEVAERLGRITRRARSLAGQ
jgi:hypothetical protein